MQACPRDIKEQIIAILAAKNVVLTIALAMTNVEFYRIIAAKYRALIRSKHTIWNSITADLYTNGCIKLAVYYARYPANDTSGLGSIYPDIITKGSPQILDKFMRSIMPKYLKSWPVFGDSNCLSISWPNFKVIKQICDELKYNITNTSLSNLLKKGHRKVAMWALDQIMKREYGFEIAKILLERGDSKLIRKLMAENTGLFLLDGAITAALKGNCEREIFDLLYGLGATTNCHDIDNAINSKLRNETLQIVLEYISNLHDHTQRSILNSLNVELMRTFMALKPLSNVALDCNKSAKRKIVETPELLQILCDQIIADHAKLHTIIGKFTIDDLKVILDYLRVNKTLDFMEIKRDVKFIETALMISDEINATDKSKSKIWLLHTYRFTLPSNLTQLMHKYDNIILAEIVCEQRKIAPLDLLCAAKVGSKIRAHYGDICSKLTAIAATTAST